MKDAGPYKGTYLLSEKAGKTRWSEWLKMGGCGMSHLDEAVVRGHYFEKKQKLEKADPTLKEIGKIARSAERNIARFGKEHLGLEDWAVPESPPDSVA